MGALRREPLVLQGDDAFRIDPRVRGTAAHLVIQSLDLSKQLDEEAVRACINGLVERGSLTREAAAVIDVEGIAAFFRTHIGQLVQANSPQVRREWPFTAGIPLRELDPAVDAEVGKEKVIVQGIIDMLVCMTDKLVIVDFKTDKLNSDNTEERTEMYRPQLQLYARAARMIIGTPAADAWLYFTSCRKLVQIPVPAV
jgi:ATP-dependent helicase/nuclease subunit A